MDPKTTALGYRGDSLRRHYFAHVELHAIRLAPLTAAKRTGITPEYAPRRITAFKDQQSSSEDELCSLESRQVLFAQTRRTAGYGVVGFSTVSTSSVS